MFHDYIGKDKYHLTKVYMELPQMTIIKDLLLSQIEEPILINDLLEIMIINVMSESNFDIASTHLMNKYDLEVEAKLSVELAYKELTFLTHRLFENYALFDPSEGFIKNSIIMDEFINNGNESYLLKYVIILEK
jgi:hypothetical protein